MIAFSALELGPARLVRFTRDHLTQSYVDWLNDPEVVRFSEQRHHHHTLESCQTYFCSMQGSGDLFLAIEALTPPLGHIGNITVSHDPWNRSADIAIMIGDPRARARGLGQCVWSGLVDYLLGQGGLRRVTAGTMGCNRSMIALMEKSGMEIEATRRRAFVLDGEEVDLVLAARFA